MSKAEQRAKERYSIRRGDDTQKTSGIDMQGASDFIEGYEQATEDICEWLKEHSQEYVYWMDEEFGKDDLINDLKQAMKDERV